MSALQVESSMSARRALIYAKVAAVIDGLPSRFTANELYAAAGIVARHPASRMVVASVLRESFRLVDCSKGGKRWWRKPDER